MKKLSLLLLCVLLLFFAVTCTREKNDISDYQYMYDGVFKDWSKVTTPGDKTSLLGFGEYMYNSELILFPRETPSTLREFYFHWTQLIDVDGFAIYFTCELNADNYDLFSQGLKNFRVYSQEKETALLFDESHFDFPTYILQWMKPEKKWEVLEYIMLDDEKHTVVFVYTMGELSNIEEHSDYHITPSEMYFLEDDFSIYSDYKNYRYDNSFLQYVD